MRALLALVALAALVAVAPGASAQNASLVLLKGAAADNGAVCIDGSPGAYYVRRGTEPGKILVQFRGGGWCDSLEDCYGRAQGHLGSSLKYPPTMDLGGDCCDSIFSTDPACSFMATWTHVHVMYCDGGSYSGANRTAASFRGEPLYFRGSLILDAVLDSLVANHGLGSATDLVVSGCSAGGLGVYLHGDRVRARAPASARALLLPDSGFFLDFQGTFGDPSARFHDYDARLRWVYAQMNATVDPACVGAAGDDPARCIFAQHAAPFLRTPVFALQSATDAWQVPEELGTTEPSLVLRYSALLVAALRDSVLVPGSRNGAFIDSCYHHCYQWGNIAIDGDLQNDAVGAFYRGLGGITAATRSVWEAPAQFPCPGCCLNTTECAPPGPP